MKVRVAAVQTKTFLGSDEQKRNIESAWHYVAEAAEQEAPAPAPPDSRTLDALSAMLTSSSPMIARSTRVRLDIDP